MWGPSQGPLLHGAQWMCPGGPLVVILESTPGNGVICQSHWVRAGARATREFPWLSHAG